MPNQPDSRCPSTLGACARTPCLRLPGIARWLTAGLTLSIVTTNPNQLALAISPQTVNQEVAEIEQPDSDDLASRVRTLRTQLDDEQLIKRVAAEQELLELGPQVLPFLEPASSNLTSEQFERLSRVRQKLEQAAAEAQGRPTRVSLSGQFTLDQALQEIAKQTGNTSLPTRMDLGAKPLELEAVTFWEAIRSLEEAFPEAQLDPYRAGEALRWTERAPGSKALVGGLSGPFRFDIIRIEAVNDFINPALSGLNVTMRVRWEPRLQPISVSQDLESLSATVQDQVLGSSSRSPKFESLIQGNPGYIDLNYVVEAPKLRADLLTQWIGSLSFTIPTAAIPFRFEQLAEKGKQESRTASTTVAIQRTTQQDDLYGVEVRIRFDESAGSLESHRGWIFDSPVRLIDSQANPKKFFTYETTLRTENEVGILYLFPTPQSLDQLSLEFEVPSAILRVPVNFAIDSIPLP